MGHDASLPRLTGANAEPVGHRTLRKGASTWAVTAHFDNGSSAVVRHTATGGWTHLSQRRRHGSQRITYHLHHDWRHSERAAAEETVLSTASIRWPGEANAVPQPVPEHPALPEALVRGARDEAARIDPALAPETLSAAVIDAFATLQKSLAGPRPHPIDVRDHALRLAATALRLAELADQDMRNREARTDKEKRG